MTPGDYKNDLSIADAARLWRRIPPWHFVFDGNLQRWRPSSAAFDNDPDGSPMSALLEELVLARGRSPIEALSGFEGYGLAAITAGLARACGQGVAHDPTPQEAAHAVVFGVKPKSIQRRLAKGSIWVVPPPQPPTA